VRVVGGALILAIVVWRFGSGPFVDGVRMVDGWSLAAATGIALPTTVFCAWRWTLVARGLGVGLPVRSAVAAYYRSQFLNTTLPGGVLGDVHRAVRHGHDVGDVGSSVRAVAAERVAGQVVQVVVATIVLSLLPSPLKSFMPLVAAALVVGVIGLVLMVQALPQGDSSRHARILRTAVGALRSGLLARRSWPGIVLASVLVVAGHTATFLVAARTAGSTESIVRLVPLALIVLVAMGIPANIGGWGPREGVAAWAFAATGVGAAQGVATAVVYGVMALVANLPGLVVLIAARQHRDRHEPPVPTVSASPLAGLAGAARG
jgi:uncharacterized membrane protein YbhN (UPF0104 family)